MNEKVKTGEQLAEWAQRHDMIFLCLFIITCAILFYILFTIGKILTKEREEMKKEREKFYQTITKQQQLNEKMHRLVEDEKKHREKSEDMLTEIDHKVDMLLREK